MQHSMTLLLTQCACSEHSGRSLGAGLFISSLVRSRCIWSVFVKLMLFPLLHLCWHFFFFFARPKIFTLFNSPQYSKLIVSFCWHGLQQGKRVHRCWHLPDNVMEWMGFQPYINLRHDKMSRCDMATDQDSYRDVCVFASASSASYSLPNSFSEQG